jgi:hypothetical protein
VPSSTQLSRLKKIGPNNICFSLLFILCVFVFVFDIYTDDIYCSLRESAPGVTGLPADGIILLADEDCSKDLILDTYGCDPTLVTSLAASSNILFDNVFAANITTKNASITSHASTPAVPPSYPSDSLFLYHSVRNSVLCSTESPQLFSNENSILSADRSLALGNTT